jgi:hypothetical protein
MKQKDDRESPSTDFHSTVAAKHAMFREYSSLAGFCLTYQPFPLLTSLQYSPPLISCQTFHSHKGKTVGERLQTSSFVRPHCISSATTLRSSALEETLLLLSKGTTLHQSYRLQTSQRDYCSRDAAEIAPKASGARVVLRTSPAARGGSRPPSTGQGGHRGRPQAATAGAGAGAGAPASYSIMILVIMQ